MISMQSSTEIEVASKKPPKEPPKERKLRILFTTFWDYPHVGGLSNYISSLQKELRERGHRVDVIAPNHFPDVKTNGLRDKIEADLQHFFLKRYKESNEKIISNLRGMLCYHYYLLREVDLQKYDVIHAQDIFTANIVGRCIHRAPKPLFFTPHGHFTSSRLKFGKFTSGSVEEAYYLQIERSAVESAKKMVILCESFRAPLNALGADDEKMKTVYTGIDFTVKRKIPPANASINGVEATKPLILTCVSRLAPRKGHKFLFEALHQIRHATGPLEVRIVGDGSTRAELEKQVKELKLTNVRFLGNSDQVAELLAQSDIFVHPTINDNLPIAIIEAMFGQQAIITTNCGGIPELIQHEQRGLIAEAGNSSDLAEKLLRVLEDRDLRERLAQQAKQFAETHLTAHNMTSQIEEMYQSVV